MAAKNPYRHLPLVYACSGCSSAAQLTNALAVLLDREKMAEMSCIAGVGGDVRSLVKTAKSDRPKIVLDGCPLHCANNCLQRHGIEPELHIDLSTEGVRKNMHEDPDPEEVERIWNSVILPRISALSE
ncbi:MULTISPECIES: putative zinc-binding protein [unclassified Microbulbifer]|uniref:putative zinc-binding protein n=1 Tax=unclassified Microbulbifer TaxID=2619833 RepID=UPI0027E55E3B|nr:MULTISPECIES: putative zinc-binding protein [unclassified Microbulbifer]